MMGMNVVQASAAAEIPALINLGSSCMYPREAENPLVETSILSGPLEPTNEDMHWRRSPRQSLQSMCDVHRGLTTSR
jgi:nucleoside-diphosphate-sugar epimerase